MFWTNIVEKIKTHVLGSTVCFPPKIRAVYEIMWENMVEPDRRQKTIWGPVRIAFWITKGTNLHSEFYVLLTVHPCIIFFSNEAI